MLWGVTFFKLSFSNRFPKWLTLSPPALGGHSGELRVLSFCAFHGGEVLRVLSEQWALDGEGLTRQTTLRLWLPGEVLVQVNQGFHLITGSDPGGQCDKKLSEVGGMCFTRLGGIR